MTKTFCDRCGAEIKQKYGLLCRKKLYTMRLIPVSMPKLDLEEDDDQYICPDCTESYINWFLNPEPTKEGDGV